MGLSFEHMVSFFFLLDVFESASASFCLLLNHQQLGVVALVAVTMCLCFILLLAEKGCLLKEG